jgi:hypothetical protein
MAPHPPICATGWVNTVLPGQQNWTGFVPRKRIPFEVLVVLQNQLDALSPRNAQRKQLIEETSESFGVSVATLRRLLRNHQLPYLALRSDYNKPRTLSESDMRRYCELIAGLKLRTTNKKGRHLSTKACIKLFETHGIETTEGWLKVEPGVLKLSTVSRYLKQWGYDNHTLSRATLDALSGHP